MPAFTASAPGKIILFGEHAVVYGRPAIAVPVNQVRARATVLPTPTAPPGQIRVTAGDIGLDCLVGDLPDDHPLALAIQGVGAMTNLDHLPAFQLKVSSTIPIAAGLGSGAAVSTAIARAVSAFLGHPLSDEQVSAIAYRVDQKHHGTPSGIDNTVIAYAQPIFFLRGQPFERLHVAQPFTVIIGNTGVSSLTSAAVGDVRQAWQLDPERYEQLFNEMGAIAYQARLAIEQGPVEALGPLMTRNHALLQEIGVSCAELDRLVTAADAAGALGAKLCGGGRGGNMIALVHPEQAEVVASALRQSGAAGVLITTVEPS